LILGFNPSLCFVRVRLRAIGKGLVSGHRYIYLFGQPGGWVGREGFVGIGHGELLWRTCVFYCLPSSRTLPASFKRYLLISQVPHLKHPLGGIEQGFFQIRFGNVTASTTAICRCRSAPRGQHSNGQSLVWALSASAIAVPNRSFWAFRCHRRRCRRETVAEFFQAS